MSDVAIRCEGLGKQYRIGERERYRALRDTLTDALRAPARRLRSAFAGGAKDAPAGVSVENTFWALRGVSFEVKHGEVMGVIGRNGAGKSTLLKILSRITRPTEGRVRINGRVGSLLEVGTGFHPELTGRENIYLNGAILGMKRAEIERKFDEIVAFAELEKFLDTPVKRYSSGMYVRLAFAVAAHLEPEILVVDEVLAVGDAAFQKKCLGKMGDVAKQGRTVLFVSHDMTAIQTLCPRAIFLRGGNVAGIGATSDQLEAYLNHSKSIGKIDSKNSLDLGNGLKLCQFEFTPNPVVSGEPVKFELALYSSMAASVKDVAVLIFDSLGKRVAILDLRKSDVVYKTDGTNILRIGAEIKALPLVEGEYHAGLWIDAHDIRKDFFDLTNITVLNRPTTEKIVPHHARLRGVVELDYSVRIALG